MHKAAIHNFPPLLVDAGKSDRTAYHLQSSTAEPAIANEFRGEREEESESGGEVEAGHEGEEVSHFPSCEAVRECGPMRASRVAATFWVERQVRAGGRSNEEADLPAARAREGGRERERERERGRLNSAHYFYDYLIFVIIFFQTKMEDPR